MQGTAVLGLVVSIVCVLAGILLSLVLPVAVKILRAARLESGEKPRFWQRVAAAWTKYGGNRYLKIILAATLVAVVLVFLLGMKFFTARDAVLAGFAWESLINKLFGGSTG
ncbi:MAG: hypothetical protein LAO78_10115 [Acidobacteriia bacterium]|nr:hypothetical protein [Terriglobia bacterium]